MSKHVKEWIGSLHNNNFKGTAISIFNKKNKDDDTEELTLYLYNTEKTELKTIHYKTNENVRYTVRKYNQNNDILTDITDSKLSLLNMFKEAHLSINISKNDADNNMIVKTITHVNGLNDELFINPLLLILQSEDKRIDVTVEKSFDDIEENDTEDEINDVEISEEAKKRNQEIDRYLSIYDDFLIDIKKVGYVGIKALRRQKIDIENEKNKKKVETIQDLIKNNEEFIKLMKAYKEYYNNYKNEKHIYDLDLRLFSKHENTVGIFYGYNSNYLTDDIDKLKSYIFDTESRDC